MLNHQLPTQKHTGSGFVEEAAEPEVLVGVAHQAMGSRCCVEKGWTQRELGNPWKEGETVSPAI